jgi:hypothetical protein
MSRASELIELYSDSTLVEECGIKKPTDKPYHTDITGKKIKKVKRTNTITPGPPPGWKPGAR